MCFDRLSTNGLSLSPLMGTYYSVFPPFDMLRADTLSTNGLSLSALLILPIILVVLAQWHRSADLHCLGKREMGSRKHNEPQ